MRTEDRRYLSDELNDLAIKSEARGEANAVLTVLRKRRINVPDEVAGVIRAETDLGVLEEYLDRAVTATTAADVIVRNDHGPATPS